MCLNRVILLCLILLASGVNISAQNCENTIKKCKTPDKSYKVSATSRSIKMRRGKKSRIVLNAYQNREYYFSAYAEKKAGKLQFRIIDAESNKILYDNSSDEMNDNKLFTVTATKKLYIELLAPNWMSKNTYECAAFKIAYRKL
ncbi:MAG: hypothetical protein N4A74_20985 [Carboxylicivirga sp.]|nr:hypothetical protein [Carboxylicivirga sp.]